MRHLIYFSLVILILFSATKSEAGRKQKKPAARQSSSQNSTHLDDSNESIEDEVNTAQALADLLAGALNIEDFIENGGSVDVLLGKKFSSALSAEDRTILRNMETFAISEKKHEEDLRKKYTRFGHKPKTGGSFHGDPNKAKDATDEQKEFYQQILKEAEEAFKRLLDIYSKNRQLLFEKRDRYRRAIGILEFLEDLHNKFREICLHLAGIQSSKALSEARHPQQIHPEYKDLPFEQRIPLFLNTLIQARAQFGGVDKILDILGTGRACLDADFKDLDEKMRGAKITGKVLVGETLNQAIASFLEENLNSNLNRKELLQRFCILHSLQERTIRNTFNAIFDLSVATPTETSSPAPSATPSPHPAASRAARMAAFSNPSSPPPLVDLVNIQGWRIVNVPGDGDCGFHALTAAGFIINRVQYVQEVVARFQRGSLTGTFGILLRRILRLRADQEITAAHVNDWHNAFVANPHIHWMMDTDLTMIAYLYNIEIMVYQFDGNQVVPFQGGLYRPDHDETVPTFNLLIAPDAGPLSAMDEVNGAPNGNHFSALHRIYTPAHTGATYSFSKHVSKGAH